MVKLAIHVRTQKSKLFFPWLRASAAVVFCKVKEGGLILCFCVVVEEKIFLFFFPRIKNKVPSFDVSLFFVLSATKYEWSLESQETPG